MKPFFFCLGAAVAIAACAKSAEKSAKDSASGATPAAASTPGGGAGLTGAGATFPYPIYSKWFDAYAAKTGV